MLLTTNDIVTEADIYWKRLHYSNTAYKCIALYDRYFQIKVNDSDSVATHSVFVYFKKWWTSWTVFQTSSSHAASGSMNCQIWNTALWNKCFDIFFGGQPFSAFLPRPVLKELCKALLMNKMFHIHGWIYPGISNHLELFSESSNSKSLRRQCLFIMYQGLARVVILVWVCTMLISEQLSIFNK